MKYLRMTQVKIEIKVEQTEHYEFILTNFFQAHHRLSILKNRAISSNVFFLKKQLCPLDKSGILGGAIIRVP